MVGFQVLEVGLGDSVNKEVFLLVSHGLDNELLVSAEEKERARGPTSFTRLEHILRVLFGVQRLEQRLSTDSIATSQVFELVNIVACDLNSFVDDELRPLVFADFTLQNRVNLRVEGHIWIIQELLLMDIFPALEVFDLYVVQSQSHREVIGSVFGDLAIFPCFEVWCFDDATDAFQDSVDQLYIETGCQECIKRVSEDVAAIFASFSRVVAAIAARICASGFD